MLNNQDQQSNTLQKLYKRKLSYDELQEAEHNLYGLLGLLAEIDRERKEPK